MVYILRTLFYDSLGLDFKITHDENYFRLYQGPKINYSDLQFDGVISIKPHTILYDHGLKDYHLEVLSHETYKKIFFKNSEAEVPFDILGASFWLLSRYEEYLPYKADKHNRFHYKSSLAYQYDFLNYPLVNLWLLEFRRLLANYYPSMVFKIRSYDFISTVDIDNAYKYKFKGFVRTIAGILSDRKLSKIKLRLKIILNKAKDPFDCYDFLIKTHNDKKVKAIYFFLLGDYGPNDKNHSAQDLRFQTLIKHLADYSEVGIHPSYGSSDNLRQLKVETNRLSTITHRIVTKSRQHFAMLKFPRTYLNLNQTGITDDYTMGYTNQNGFRASFCYPYKWYILETESVSQLLIHPFCITENSLLNESDIFKKGFLEVAEPYCKEVKKYGGELISVFHNDMFGVKMKKLYLEFIDKNK